MLANYPQDCTNCLTGDQANAFADANPQVDSAIQYLGIYGTWPNGNPGTVGYAIQDQSGQFGTVMLAMDAKGTLYYLSNAPVNIAQQNAAPYQSPTTGGGTLPTCPGWGNISGITDFFACLGQTASGALGIGAIVFVLWLLKE